MTAHNWRDLTNDKFFDRYPRWSPDGKKIAFRLRPQRRLRNLDDRRGRHQPSTGNFWRHAGYFFSAVVAGRQATAFPNQALVSYTLDLSKDLQEQTPQPLAPMDNPDDYFVAWDWSPDGKKLCGQFRGTSGDGIGYYSFETKRYEKLTDYASLPMWLPDSRRFIFARRRQSVHRRH